MSSNTPVNRRWMAFREEFGPRPGGRGAQARWDAEWELYKERHPLSLVEKLDSLLDEAVWEGRSNWDGYYGSDNTYHMNTIKELPLYAEIVEDLTKEN